MKLKFKTTFFDESGFTVIEMLTAILIVGVIVGAILGFLQVNNNSYVATANIVDMQYDGQIAFNQLGELIMESSEITNFVEDTALNKNTLTIKVEELEESNWKVATYIFVFEKDNGKIKFTRKIEGAVDTPIEYIFAENVSEFKVTESDGVTPVTTSSKLIKVVINFAKQNTSLNLENTFMIRNN